jgi:hypothetical protein
LEFKFTYNYDVYEKPSFFLPKSQPTFAIWLQEKNSGAIQTIYVTAKAGKNKWILAEARPESVPVWFGIRQKEKVDGNLSIDADISKITTAQDTFSYMGIRYIDGH